MDPKTTPVKARKTRQKASKPPQGAYTASRRSFNVPVAEIEFTEGNNTLWVHGHHGGTVLRVKCTGKIRVDDRCNSPVPHADLMVEGDIVFCLPAKVGR